MAEAVSRNEAFVFVKPHAVNDKVIDVVTKTLTANGITITGQGTITSEQIDADSLIDNHYYAIASKATLMKPAELNVPADKFKAKFGLGWQEALDQGVVYNAMDGGAKLGMDATQLEKAWRAAKVENDACIKFGGGFYCSKIQDIYIFNGFFMSMRNKYVAPGKSIQWFTVSWDSNSLSWEDFRGKVLGPTNPADAPATSVRGIIYNKWETLGLEAQPDTGDNGVHASASPFEGLAERANWLKCKIEDDGFGKQLLSNGISLATIKAWSVDPQVQVDADGTKGSLFDALEDMNVGDCLAKAKMLNGF